MPPSPHSLLCATLLLCRLLATGPAEAEQVDRVVAVAGERVVTLSDLAFEEEMTPWLDCPEVVLCDPERPLMDRVVDITVIRGLAGDSAIYRPTSEEVDRRVADIKAAWNEPRGYAAFLARWGMMERDLAGRIFSRMVVERYVQRSVGLPVMAAGGDQGDYRRRYREWIEEQRERVGIRRIDPVEPG